MSVFKLDFNGIIPARAGFTDESRPGSPQDADHPRSRGVYSDSARADSLRSGSSPLARGLPNDKSPWAERPRIIPARAGFTLLYPRFGSLLTDHPRSRGVYRLEWCASPRPPGSSPLARGLRPIIRSAESRRGIIPARAGFTPCPGRGTSRRWDHPRSRGVYTHSGPSAPASTGSSPLARGLQARLLRDGFFGGIIPARAGFTVGFPSLRVLSGDHPRSRGVYGRAAAQGASNPGSSPLARGLPVGCAGAGHAVGIIPARAGFTVPPHHRGPVLQDHPRSRGVYFGSIRCMTPAPGSSPLARGLRAAAQRLDESGRIIPARAGFTPAQFYRAVH